VYLIDGVNITNPLFGYLATEINELDILEINAKRGAVSAAAGRAQGFISNAVTKSGTNRFAGGYRFEAIPADWVKESRNGVRAVTDKWVNAGSVGGPIVENRVFFYGRREFSAPRLRARPPTGPIPDSQKDQRILRQITTSIRSEYSLNAGYQAGRRESTTPASRQ
jgi:hypothetical protein